MKTTERAIDGKIEIITVSNKLWIGSIFISNSTSKSKTFSETIDIAKPEIVSIITDIHLTPKPGMANISVKIWKMLII